MADTASTTGTSEQEAGPLDGVQFVNGSFVISGETAEAANDDAARSRFREVVTRLCDDDRFYRFLRRLYCWAGRRYKVKSLEISETDQDFREACDLLYTDLKDGVLGPVIDTLPVEALGKILVYSVGFGLPVVGAYKEVSARKRTEKTGDRPKNKKTEGTPENE